MRIVQRLILPLLLLLFGGVPALAQSGSWTVSEAKGSVTIIDARGSRAAKVGAQLAEGATVRTAAQSSAVLVRGKEFVTMRQNAQLRIAPAERERGIVQILQDYGSALFNIGKQPNPHFGVDTPYLAAVVKGTTFVITVTNEGASLQVTEGAVETSTLDGGAVELIRPGSVAMIAAADPLRMVIEGEGRKVLDSPARAQLFQRSAPGQPRCEVVLIESPDIGTIGVGEATIPTIRQYNRALGLDAAEFLRRTQASFKLGIEFKDWGWLGHRFFHGFGDFGPPIEGRSPWQHWLRLREPGDISGYEDGSTASVMARHCKFTPPEGDRPSAANAFSYAVHFDASLYAGFLREHAVRHGAQRIEGTLVEVEQRPEDGFVRALRLADGRRIEGDLFVDCSGLRGLLIEGVMKAGFHDWSAMLPVNSAWAMPCSRSEPLRRPCISTTMATPHASCSNAGLYNPTRLGVICT